MSLLNIVLEMFIDTGRGILSLLKAVVSLSMLETLISTVMAFVLYLAREAYKTRMHNREILRLAQATKAETAIIHKDVNSRTDKLDARIEALNGQVAGLMAQRGEFVGLISGLKKEIANLKSQSPGEKP